MKKVFGFIFFKSGQLSHIIVPSNLLRILIFAWNNIYSGRVAKKLKQIGPNSKFLFPTYLKGGNFIEIGENFRASYRFRLEAWEEYSGMTYRPRLKIGSNVSLSDNCHIGAINEVIIGNNVLVGSNVFITDHFHGNTTERSMGIPPLLRSLYSKGSVIIGDNVWIGDGVVILPNVKLGSGCIVGANAVVAKDFSENSIIAGVPARKIKLNN